MCPYQYYIYKINLDEFIPLPYLQDEVGCVQPLQYLQNEVTGVHTNTIYLQEEVRCVHTITISAKWSWMCSNQYYTYKKELDVFIPLPYLQIYKIKLDVSCNYYICKMKLDMFIPLPYL